MELVRKDCRKYVNNHYLKRNDVVPFYVDLILTTQDPFDAEVKRVNELILSKWTTSGLIYIKEKAWSQIVEYNIFNITRKALQKEVSGEC